MNINKIIAYKGNRIIKFSAQLTDKLNFNLLESHRKNFLLGEDLAYKIFNHFNAIPWNSKSIRILKLNDPEQELQDDKTKNTMKKAIEKYLSEIEEDEHDLDFTSQEYYYLERDYNCSQKDLIEQLGFFNDMPIPTKTISFLEGYVQQVEDIELSKQQLRKLYIENTAPMEEVKEYVMYIGPNDKFKGFVGEVIQHRDDIAPNLVKFYTLNEKGRNYKFWSKEENLVRFLF